MKNYWTLFLIIITVSCKNDIKKSFIKPDKENITLHHKNFQLKEGDILFQDSDCGPFCESIEKVTFGIYGSKFSHVGMIISDEKDKLKVIEAITDGVVVTSLDTFFNRSFDEDNNSKVVVGRLKKDYNSLILKAIKFARTKLGAKYDAVFDIDNNNYYCSELIYESFKYANNHQPIFELQKMTFKDPETNEFFPIWVDYFKKLNIEIPEGEPGLNPGGMSKSNYLDIVHFYGKPEGFNGELAIKTIDN